MGTKKVTLPLRATNQILIFMADPPFRRHEDENSAMLDENLHNVRLDAHSATAAVDILPALSYE
jgi:hypothetical protein